MSTEAREMRTRAGRMRFAADALDRAADLLEGSDDKELLRGHRIIDKLVELGRDGEVLHYMEALERLLDHGYCPAGVDPGNTLLAALGRDERFEATRRRSGRYTQVVQAA